MVTRILIVVLFFISSICFSQKGKFKSNVQGSDKFVSEIPHFVNEKSELDTFIFLNLIYPESATGWGIDADVCLSFEVDTNKTLKNMVVVDYTVLLNKMIEPKSDQVLINLKREFVSQAKRVIKLTEGLWVPAMEKGIRVSKPVFIKIQFITSMFNKKNDRVFQNTLHPKNENVVNNEYMNQGYNESLNRQKELYGFGVRKLLQKKYELSSFYLNLALEVKQEPAILYFLGTCYYNLGHTLKACDYWERAERSGVKEASDFRTKYCN